MRIYLVGFMGAGKSTVGRCLARRLGYPFVDLDSEVEHRSGRLVETIFREEGEEGFRRQESAALRALLRHERLVLATGGGTPTRAENASQLESTGTTVFLDPPLDLLFERVERSARVRPLFRDRDQARALYERRLPAYRAARVRVPVTREDAASDVVEKILERLETERCAT